jgi:hypothetical protein
VTTLIPVIDRLRASCLLHAIDGVPRLIVPDNAKVAVIRRAFTSPRSIEPSRDGGALRTAVLATRPRRPRDKAKVEACVLIVERWHIGRLRDRRFYSLAELNAAVGELLKRLNEERPIRRLGLTADSSSKSSTGRRSSPCRLRRMARASDRDRPPRRGRAPQPASRARTSRPGDTPVRDAMHEA